LFDLISLSIFRKSANIPKDYIFLHKRLIWSYALLTIVQIKDANFMHLRWV